MGDSDISRLRTDPGAWEAFYPEIWATAQSVVRRKLRDGDYSADVDDVCIQSIEKIVRRLPKYPEIRTLSELRRMTASVAYGEANSHLRSVLAKKRGEGKFRPIDEMPGETQDFAASEDSQPDEIAAANDRIDFVMQLLGQLKPREKELLQDFFIHGKKHREIAKNRGMAVGSIGVTLGRALDAAKNLLEHEPELMTTARLLGGISAIVLLLLS